MTTLAYPFSASFAVGDAKVRVKDMMSPLIAIYQEMTRGDVLWSDFDVDFDFDVSYKAVPIKAIKPIVTNYAPECRTLEASWAHEEALLWAQPFARNLEARPCDYMDMESMSDADYASLMTWLYAHGWALEHECRESVRAVPSDEPSRVWVPMSRFTALVNSSSSGSGGSRSGSGSAPAPAPAGPNRAARRAALQSSGAPRPIFCGGGEKCKDGCPYVHGDTIPVKNVMCGGPREGPHAGDAAHCTKRVAAVGSTPCTHLHPDEVWSETLVRCRPVA
jgi:hypothetical protein